MAEELKSGSLLVHANCDLPEPLQVQGPVVVPRWKVLSGIDAAKAERELKRLGWHFFYVVDAEPTARGMARDRDKAVKRAVAKLAERAESERLNTLEVTDIYVRRYGFVCIAKVAVNFRHIGRTPYLFERVTSSPKATTQKPVSKAV